MGQFLCTANRKINVEKMLHRNKNSSSKFTNIGLNCTRIVVGRTKSNYGIKGLEAFLLCLIPWPLRAVNTEGAGGQLPQSVFGKSVKPIPAIELLCLPHHSGCLDLKKILSTIDPPPGVPGVSKNHIFFSKNETVFLLR